MPRIVLLKTPPSPSADQNDPYRSQFENAGYEVDYVPVLKEEYQIEELSRLLLGDDNGNGSGGGEVGEAGAAGGEWAGVVITSKRGAEGWIKAAEACSSTQEDKSTDWTSSPLFTVGTSSLDHLSKSQDSISPRLRFRTDIARTAKSAIELLPILTSHHTQGRYLIIRGDKTTNELQAGLSGVGISYEEVGVYTTSPRVDLSANLEKAIGRSSSSSSSSPSSTSTSSSPLTCNERKQNAETWMAFFSPSSAELVLPILDDRLAQYGVAAIGGTTEKYLKEHGVDVKAVADQPTAEGLLAAIQSCRGEKT